MPFERVNSILESIHGWCEQHGLSFGAFPMHEVAAHPDAARLLKLFAAHDRMLNPFEPFTTTGVPLATRDDWRDVLRAAQETGTTVVWSALHGSPEQHDRRVNRRGAFAETCLAIERVHSAGMAVGCNVFVTSENVEDMPRIAQILNDLDVEESSWQPSDYYPQTRTRRNERLRPTLDQLLPFAPEIARWSSFYREHWADLGSLTEAAWVRRAASGEWPIYQSEVDFGSLLVLRPNQDLHFGRAGEYGERFGNLAINQLDEVLTRALGATDRQVDEIWFRPDELLTIEAAAHFGDPDGTAIHFSADSVRYLWLDRSRNRAPTPRRVVGWGAGDGEMRMHPRMHRQAIGIHHQPPNLRGSW